MAAQHELIELLGLIVAKERILQRLRSVFILEDQPEGVLRILLCQTAMTAMQAQAAGGGEVGG